MMRPREYHAAVLGAGGWGTALSIHLSRDGRPVSLWGRDPALVEQIARRRANPTYLPGVALPPEVSPCADVAAALRGVRHVIVAVPSHGLRAVVREAVPYLPGDAILVSATKGLETDTLCRMSEVMLQETGGRLPV